VETLLMEEALGGIEDPRTADAALDASWTAPSALDRCTAVSFRIFHIEIQY
jgi:hypothetical protein